MELNNFTNLNLVLSIFLILVIIGFSVYNKTEYFNLNKCYKKDKMGVAMPYFSSTPCP